MIETLLEVIHLLLSRLESRLAALPQLLISIYMGEYASRPFCSIHYPVVKFALCKHEGARKKHAYHTTVYQAR